MDLDVLQVNLEDIEEVVDIGTSENINVGEPVIAIGNPLSHMFAGSVKHGIISSKLRSIPLDFNQDGCDDWKVEYLTKDIAIKSGNNSIVTNHTTSEI